MHVSICKLTLIAAALSATLTSNAQTTIADFEDIPIGTSWTLWGEYGTGTTTATVVEDPTNKNNHVLHIVTKDWGIFPEFTIPETLVGAAFNEKVSTIRFRYYRNTSEGNAYKQMHVYLGNQQLYADASYPYQGDAGSWQNRSYKLQTITDDNKSNLLHVGIHENTSDYYIDDVMLYGLYDDYKTIESGILNICTQNTSSSYTTYTTPLIIPEGKSLTVYTSRYTDFASPIAGTGTLNIYGGGERTYLGNHSDKKYPAWDAFTGDVNIYPYNEVEKKAGFYGVVMAHNGKTFSPEDVEGCIADKKVCNMMENNKVTLHDGAAIAMENGTHAARYGELNTEKDSRLYGYYKASNAGSYYIVGHLGTDATLAGRIAPMESNGTPLASQLLGIIKEGKGTYTITGNDNVIPAGVRVIGGRLNINNDAATAKASKLSGGTGAPASATAASAYVYDGGILGGTGNIAGNVEAYGTVEPGTAETTGTLFLANYHTSSAASLTLHPNARLRFKVKSASEYDRLVVSDDVKYSNICQNFTTSEEMPVIRIALDSEASLSVGDEMEVLTAKSKADVIKWTMLFPSRYTWEMNERTNTDGSYSLIMKVVSLDNDPANKDNDKNEAEETGKDNQEDDNRTFESDGDANTLAHYATTAGFRIGTAVSSYTDPSQNSSQMQLIDSNFNMLVPENCLKFDATEPSRNTFTFGDADKLVNHAVKNGQYMRGHTLAWHSQVAQWISSDGKKNDKNWTKEQLLDILKNHIMTVVTRYKGKIAEWDVVNECLDDDQSIVRTEPNNYKLRQQSVWTLACGEAFIDSAFVWAHRADPDCRLILNDYSNESMGSAKAQAFYNLAKRLKDSGIPIHGVGLQCHMDAGSVNIKALGETLKRFGDIGLDCIITELDLGINDRSNASLQQQARDYYDIIATAAQYSNCRSVLIWGLSDDLSWRNNSNPLLWDASLKAKPAYYAIQQSLRNLIPTAIEEVATPPIRMNTDRIYNIFGQRVTANTKGLVIINGKKYIR